MDEMDTSKVMTKNEPNNRGNRLTTVAVLRYSPLPQSLIPCACYLSFGIMRASLRSITCFPGDAPQNSPYPSKRF